MRHNENEVRTAAQSLYENIERMHARNVYTTVDLTRSHSINLVTEEFLGGYTQDGRMSVVRRFFCLFVTFDLFFVSLLWLIAILITGDNIYVALKQQILQYSVHKSLFDIVMAAICRFVVLLLFYALLYINHWFVIALSTAGSCMFLISKVFVYDWVGSHQPVFEVVLIITSFVLAWGEAWFLDCRVIPQERNARNTFLAIAQTQPTDRSPLISPFLDIETAPPDSTLNFYSPYDSTHNSDEENEQNEEYKNMGNECVRKAYDLLEASNWKIETVTEKGDTIQSIQKAKLGKIYRLTARIHFPAKQLHEELFYKIEDVPKWNPTLLESTILKKIDSHTDISYQATVSGGGGLVKSRDFVNLRCWRLCRNGKIVDSEDEDDDDDDVKGTDRSCEHSVTEGSVSTISDNEGFMHHDDNDGIAKSTSDAKLSDKKTLSNTAFKTLSKSLGAKDFHGSFDTEPPPLEDEFSDALGNPNQTNNSPKINTDKIYISAAVSISYPEMPECPKYIRGQNLISCWAVREVPGKLDHCIFEWLLCLDLKGYIPKYVLDTAYRTLMVDYMTHLRNYCKEMRQKRRKVPNRRVYS